MSCDERSILIGAKNGAVTSSPFSNGSDAAVAVPVGWDSRVEWQPACVGMRHCDGRRQKGGGVVVGLRVPCP